MYAAKAACDGPAAGPYAHRAMRDLERLRRQFAVADRWFHDSPLYQVLALTVAGDDELLALAAYARAGQQPTNLMMAATHEIVLANPTLAFARFFTTIAGADVQTPQDAAREYAAFCADHRETLTALLAQRLVQTNEPARATAVRLALHEIAGRVSGPLTMLEIGPSAGIQLCFDRWAVETGGRRFGPARAPLTIVTEWRGDRPVPDLDVLPTIRERLGLDLHPVDATDPRQRRWLQALVWPEHTDRFAQLARALDAVAADPPELLAGDAIERLPELDGSRLATDVPLVVFHSQVRIHVAEDRRAAFDAAIDALGVRRRLLHVALEHRDTRSPVISLHDTEGDDVDLAIAHGHGRWIQPLTAG
jgi:hypothetical protein